MWQQEKLWDTEVWTAEEMAEIIHDAESILADRSIRPLSTDAPIRMPGHWELMRLDQYNAIKEGRIYIRP